MKGSPSLPRVRLEQAARRLGRMFARPAFRVLVFVVAMALFYWPFLSQASGWSGEKLFLFLFGTWLVVILLLFLMGMSLPTRPDRRPGEGGGAGPGER